jgi:hypothetical protein
VHAAFELTDAYMKSDRASKVTGGAADVAATTLRPQREAPRPALSPHPDFLADEEANPLLSPAEAEQKRRQEIQSAFLAGIVVGAGAVGAFFVVKWILSKPKEVGEILAESM